MFEHSLDNQSKSSFDKSSPPMKPLTIIDFQRPDDAADARAVSIGSKQQGWRISDDEVIGGFSRASLTLWNAAPSASSSSSSSSQLSSSSSSSTSSSSSSFAMKDDSNLAFVRWTGHIDTRIGPKSRAKRSGFCAIRCPEFPLGGIPVGDKYNALEIKCRTDGRAYTLNLKVQSYFPDDLYQSLITVQPDQVLQEYMRLREHYENDCKQEFISVVLPFRDFILTSYGRMKAQQRHLDGGIQIEHLGFTLMDGKDGPFTFDLARIRLVNYSAVEGKIMNDDDTDSQLDYRSSSN